MIKFSTLCRWCCDESGASLEKNTGNGTISAHRISSILSTPRATAFTQKIVVKNRVADRFAKQAQLDGHSQKTCTLQENAVARARYWGKTRRLWSERNAAVWCSSLSDEFDMAMSTVNDCAISIYEVRVISERDIVPLMCRGQWHHQRTPYSTDGLFFIFYFFGESDVCYWSDLSWSRGHQKAHF